MNRPLSLLVALTSQAATYDFATGPTEDFENFLGSLMNYSGAHGTYSSSGSKTITGTQNGTNSTMVGLSAIFQ